MNDSFIAIIIIALFGFVFALFGVLSLVKRQRLLKNGIAVTGIVEKIVVDKEDDGSKYYFPVVKFKTNDEQWITKRSVMSDTKGIYKVGGSVKIRYNADKPEDFIINDMNTYAVAYLFMVIGMGIMAAAAIWDLCR